MLFNSTIFFIFLGVILPIFYALPTKKSKNIHLLISSYIFYGYWDWRFCFLLLLSTIIDYFVGIKIFESENNKKRKKLLLISLFSNLGILGFFKYFNFFIDSFDSLINSFGGSLDFVHLNIILPVGISFYTFQTLSYTIDIYRKKLDPTTNFIDFALFVSFFPQLVAGPIERAKHLLPQLDRKLSPTKNQIAEGIELIVYGLFKKILIGDAIGRIADNIFAYQEYYSSLDLLLALILFSIQIYVDFSGYSNIARGTAKLLGVEIMINFEQPYLSRNITEFWRRWHISLSSWLKDYLYISLGGNRDGKIRTYLNLMITMLLGGLWHGASWNFVIWGGLHGLYLSVHKAFLRGEKISNDRIEKKHIFGDVFYIFLTYILVLITWLFFRIDSFSASYDIILKFFKFSTSSISLRLLKITMAFIGTSFLLDIVEYKFNLQNIFRLIKSPIIAYSIIVPIFFIILMYMLQNAPYPFIYFQF